MISFIWCFATDILIFQHQSLEPPPYKYSSLWHPLCTLQIWVRHPPPSLDEMGGWGGALRSHDRRTWFPSYKKAAAAASRQHLKTSITAQQLNHTGGGSMSVEINTSSTHYTCCGMIETHCSRVLAFNLNFLTFPLTAYQLPLPPSLSLSCCRHADSHSAGGAPSTLNWPSKPPRCFDWTDLSFLVQERDKLISEKIQFKVIKMVWCFNHLPIQRTLWATIKHHVPYLLKWQLSVGWAMNQLLIQSESVFLECNNKSSKLLHLRSWKYSAF